MDRQKWLAIRDSGSLGQLFRQRGRMIHQSCAVAMLPNEAGIHAIPWVEKPGHTRNLGRNAAKRAARAA
jgi:hypothetical protein